MSSPIDQILNASHEELIKRFKEMNQGTLQSFRNQFIILYETQKHLKDGILDRLSKDEITSEDAEDTLKNMYLIMQKIEDVVNLANEVIEDKISTTLTLNNEVDTIKE